MYEWLAGSLVLLGIWLIIFVFNKKFRKEMFWVSLFTMPLGLTEPLFVPEYWNPPSVFNLAQNTGFDIESLIFSFSIGGIISVLYELFFRKQKHSKTVEIHSWHLLAVLSPFFIFAFLFMAININPIYNASIAMLFGAVIVFFCRKDLLTKMLAGGFLFTVLYFFLVLFFDFSYPGYIERVWNLKAVSGILFFRVPLEELLFAFSAGTLWSSLYEHIKKFKLS